MRSPVQALSLRRTIETAYQPVVSCETVPPINVAITHAPRMSIAPMITQMKFSRALLNFSELPRANTNINPEYTMKRLMIGNATMTTTFRKPAIKFGTELKAELSGFCSVPADCAATSTGNAKIRNMMRVYKASTMAPDTRRGAKGDVDVLECTAEEPAGPRNDVDGVSVLCLIIGLGFVPSLDPRA